MGLVVPRPNLQQCPSRRLQNSAAPVANFDVMTCISSRGACLLVLKAGILQVEGKMPHLCHGSTKEGLHSMRCAGREGG